MTTIARMRRFLGLRQIDVEIATGVPIRRLSAAERGVLRLSQLEECLVTAYLRDRLRIVQEVSAVAAMVASPAVRDVEARDLAFHAAAGA